MTPTDTNRHILTTYHYYKTKFTKVDKTKTKTTVKLKSARATSAEYEDVVNKIYVILKLDICLFISLKISKMFPNFQRFFHPDVLVHQQRIKS